MHPLSAGKARIPIAASLLAMAGAWTGAEPVARAGTLKGQLLFPAIHEDVDPRPEARKPLGAWRLENGRLPIAAEADVHRAVVLALESQQPVVAEPKPLAIEARPGGALEPAFTLSATGVIVTWRNGDSRSRSVTLEEGDTLLPPEPSPPGATREVRFTISGEYVFLDPEHPTARALVVVTNTPYVVRADDRGAFALDAPDGKYRLKAWWRGHWSDLGAVDVGRGRDPVTVRLSSDGSGRLENRSEPGPSPLGPSPAPGAQAVPGAPGAAGAAGPGAPALRPGAAPPRPPGTAGPPGTPPRPAAGGVNAVAPRAAAAASRPAASSPPKPAPAAARPPVPAAREKTQ